MKPEEEYPDKNFFGLSKVRKRDAYTSKEEEEKSLNRFGQVDYRLESELQRYKDMSSFDKLHNKRHDFQIPIAVASYDGARQHTNDQSINLTSRRSLPPGESPSYSRPISNIRMYNSNINPHVPIQKQINAQVDSNHRHMAAVKHGLQSIESSPYTLPTKLMDRR